MLGCFMRIAKKFVMPNFYEIAKFDRSRRAQQHIKNPERHIVRQKSFRP